MAKRFAKIVLGSAAAGIGVLAAVDPERRQQVAATGIGFQRFGRTFAYGAMAAYDYKFVLGAVEKEHGKISPEYKEKRKEVDKRNAERMLYVCKKHGSFYVKLGQYISTLNYALPVEWTDTLKELQDRARFRPWSDMAAVVKEDLGQAPEQVFASISEQPIAAASLAQVHKGVTHDGQTIAVKIQYPDLRWLAHSDLAAMNVFFHAVELLFPEYGYTWLFPEFRQVLALELDFLHEARTAERVAAQFSREKHLHIPRVRRDLTSDRVLTMEFIEGSRADDKAWMAAHGVDPKAVAHLVTRFFAEQVHEMGMLHLDPHPGNLMVRTEPGTGVWQLVVLDHGMYRQLTPTFRSAYCRLWKALLTNDIAAGEAAVIGLGLRADEYDAMSLILTMRRANSDNGLGRTITKKEAFEVYDKYKDVTPADINAFLQRLPRDLLFVSRNANLVRSLNMSRGGTTRDRFKAHGRAAVKGLVLDDALRAAGLDFRGGEGSTLVSSTTSIAGTGEAVVADSTQSVWASIAALVGKPPPPREPVTYGQALARGLIRDTPTEYEVLAAYRAGTLRRYGDAAGLPVNMIPDTVVSSSSSSSSSTAAGAGRGIGMAAAEADTFIVSVPALGVWGRAKLWLSWANLELRLVLMDALFALTVALYGDPEVYVSPYEEQRRQLDAVGKERNEEGKEGSSGSSTGSARRRDFG